MTQSVYWYTEEEEGDMGNVEVEWKFDFTLGEYLSLYCDGLEVVEFDYPDEWNEGVKLAQEALACPSQN